MPHHFGQQRPRETQESVPWTIARSVFVWNFIGSDPDVIEANQVEPGDMALNEDEDSWVWSGLSWVQVDSSQHVSVTLDTDVDLFLSISGQQLTLDSQSSNLVFAGPTSGGDATPTFRALVDADIPAAIARDSELHNEAHAAAQHNAAVLPGANENLGAYYLDIDDIAPPPRSLGLGYGGSSSTPLLVSSACAQMLERRSPWSPRALPTTVTSRGWGMMTTPSTL